MAPPINKEHAKDVKDDVEHIKEVAIVHVDDVDDIIVDSAYVVSENETSTDDETTNKNIEQNIYDDYENHIQVDVTENGTNPSQSVNNTVNINVAKFLVCKQCSFEATKKEDMKLHKLNAYNWCSICFSTFN